MSTPKMDWDALQDEWLRAGDAATTVASAGRQLRLARRGALIGQIIEAAIAGAAVAFVGLALMHAANVLEAALGIFVGAAICAIWLRRRDLAREEQRSLEAGTTDHLGLVRVVRQRQTRLAQFIWIVLALDLVFLVPWWVIGSRVHSRRLTDIGSVETMWLPLLGMALIAVWAWRMRRRAKRDLREIEPRIAELGVD
jgi:NADH:ubiquinone oxidoreductase subunit 3 (subunit A)